MLLVSGKLTCSRTTGLRVTTARSCGHKVRAQCFAVDVFSMLAVVAYLYVEGTVIAAQASIPTSYTFITCCCRM
jgi:hypothetical protein